MPESELVSLLRQKIKYVFVIFNENHSFYIEFGTFPGCKRHLLGRPKPRSAANTPGFYQTYTDNVTGATVTVQPFQAQIRIPRILTVMDSVDHSTRA